MRNHLLAAVAILSTTSIAALAQADVAPTGTLRAAYLSTNPAQSTKDPQTGEPRGASYDLARELAKRIGKPLAFNPIAGPPAVIEAVKSGQADIGFVAYEATRLGTVEFSQTYMLVHRASWCWRSHRSARSPTSTAPASRSPAPATTRSRSASSVCSSRPRRWSSTTMRS